MNSGISTRIQSISFPSFHRLRSAIWLLAMLFVACSDAPRLEELDDVQDPLSAIRKPHSTKKIQKKVLFSQSPSENIIHSVGGQNPDGADNVFDNGNVERGEGRPPLKQGKGNVPDNRHGAFFRSMALDGNVRTIQQTRATVIAAQRRVQSAESRVVRAKRKTHILREKLHEMSALQDATSKSIDSLQRLNQNLRRELEAERQKLTEIRERHSNGRIGDKL